jgi:WhiB family transcriptional regulator, redox-sensing transcriptional regulator
VPERRAKTLKNLDIPIARRDNRALVSNVTAGNQRGVAAMADHDFEWRMAGACRGLNPDIFYPDEDDEADVAKAICESCVVQVACLEHALLRREKVGVWGGATERERRRMIRQRRRSA